MEYVAPTLLFLLGFSAALLVMRGVVIRGRGGRASLKLPWERGAVRLDDLARGSRKRRGRTDRAEPGREGRPAASDRDSEQGPGKRKATRSGRRKHPRD